MRIGGKKKPFYRVVVVEERSKRTGYYTELLGTYNPLTTPKEIKLKQDRIDYWIKQGAQPSTGFLRITGKAPQRLPRKPKKEKKAEPSAVSPQPSDQKAEEIKQEEVVKEVAQEEVKIEEVQKEEPVVEEVKVEETKQEEQAETPTPAEPEITQEEKKEKSES